MARLVRHFNTLALQGAHVDLLESSWNYIQENPDRFEEALRVHLELSLYSLLLAIAIFVPLGALTSRSERLGALLVGLVSGARVVPSIAVLFLLYPWRRQLGDLAPFWPASFTLAIVALTILAGPPLLINIDAGLRGVDAGILENARGLGMTEHQVFLRIQAPLALPVAVAGIRIAAIEVIASATIAAFVGAGGLGRFITSGLTLLDYSLLLVGAIPVTLLALIAGLFLSGLERRITPPTSQW